MTNVKSEDKLDLSIEKLEAKYKGLNKGATTILLILTMVIIFQNPIYFSFLEKGLVFLKLGLIPESIFIIGILGMIALVTTIQGLILSIKNFNLRGLLLSLIGVFFFIGIGMNGNNFYKTYSNVTKDKKVNMTSFFTIEERSEYSKQN